MNTKKVVTLVITFRAMIGSLIAASLTTLNNAFFSASNGAMMLHWSFPYGLM
jgi:hypothetical protein